MDLLCQDLVLFLFTIEVFGPFRSIVDDLGDLERDGKYEILHDVTKEQKDSFNSIKKVA